MFLDLIQIRKGVYMLIVFNRFMGIQFDQSELEKAVICGACNDAAVYDQENDRMIADFRTEASEADEKG